MSRTKDRVNGRPQNVKTAARPKAKKQGVKSPPKLVRTTFKTSREMDFFSERELVTQTGHDRHEWPFVIVKELVDNALDACEEADVPPRIEITADPEGITVSDNGPGLPEETLHGALDFAVRTSNREAYVSPCRGAQGNALKTLIPMPVVLDSEHGRLIIEAHGKRHEIRCGADPISQRPVIHDDETNARTKGTTVRVQWSARDRDGDPLWPFGEVGIRPKARYSWGLSFPDLFYMLVEGFALFNPHATIALNWFGENTVWKATDTAWTKWRPHQPTSATWYELRHLERLIGAYITHDRAHDRDRLVSEFVAEFDGMSGSQKRAKVLDEAGLHRVRLSELVIGDRFDSARTQILLEAMQRHSRPVRSRRLGILGEEHLKARLIQMGVQADSFRYSRRVSDSKCKNRAADSEEKPSVIPWVLESAFGYLGADASAHRRIYTGANWSAAIKNPFRSFGSTGEGLETALADMRATSNQPVVFVLHLAHPRVEYTDRGKSALVIGSAA